VVDVRLRDSTAPALADLAGLRILHAGRRGTDPRAERILATVWASEEDLVAAAGASDALLPSELELDPADPELEVLPIGVEVAASAASEASVLRVFTGIVRAGELDAYAEEARQGTLDDIAAGHGPTSLYLAVDRPDRFITLSVWSGWTAIERATGGNIHKPISTKHAGRLAVATADHYELVPGTLEALTRGRQVAVRQPAVVD
jgi:hypothetical protein